MTNTSDASSVAVSTVQLAQVTGGGGFADIGKLFGDKGAKWGGVADSVLGMFGSGGLTSLLKSFGGMGTAKPSTKPSSSGETKASSPVTGSSEDKLAGSSGDSSMDV
jgi:hypothetical protein